MVTRGRSGSRRRRLPRRASPFDPSPPRLGPKRTKNKGGQFALSNHTPVFQGPQRAPCLNWRPLPRSGQIGPPCAAPVVAARPQAPPRRVRRHGGRRRRGRSPGVAGRRRRSGPGPGRGTAAGRRHGFGRRGARRGPARGRGRWGRPSSWGSAGARAFGPAGRLCGRGRAGVPHALGVGGAAEAAVDRADNEGQRGFPARSAWRSCPKARAASGPDRPLAGAVVMGQRAARAGALAGGEEAPEGAGRRRWNGLGGGSARWRADRSARPRSGGRRRGPRCPRVTARPAVPPRLCPLDLDARRAQRHRAGPPSEPR